ncbi:fasciclin domain-containing protein [Aliinostoc sp. HNIBRCY26]|uniref:fasciclin domain-containing protein n=1 Tax=Aliinostoc sp. HNIBRCY26 TaxID=3418997 RepID=UPI003D0101B1
MTANSSLAVKALFNILGAGSLITLSACTQPTTETPTTNLPEATSTPVNTATVPPVSPTPTVTNTSPTPNSTTTSNRNLAELATAAANQGQFQTLLKAVKAAGLSDQLTTPGPYTVFAPTDAAFAQLPKTTLDNLLQSANKQQLVKLLAYHVIPGRFTSQQLQSGQLKTLEGKPVNIKVDPSNQTITVNDAKVTQADIPASNGIVHVVDKVILPPDFSNSLNTAPTTTPTTPR